MRKIQLLRYTNPDLTKNFRIKLNDIIKYEELENAMNEEIIRLVPHKYPIKSIQSRFLSKKFSMVRMRGLEPPRFLRHSHLKAACMPVSPHPLKELFYHKFVPEGRFELPNPFEYSVLNTARLPVSPPGHTLIISFFKPKP